MDEIHAKLLTFTPPPYELEWNSYPQTPIRFRINSTKEESEVYNFLWIEAITKVTGKRHSESEKCINFTIPWEATNIYVSIFPSTGTVMFQGKAAPHWAEKHMQQIHTYIVRDEKGYLKPASCIVCNLDGNNEMLVCDRSMCGNWTHHKCAGYTEESASSVTYWCIKCQKQIQDQNIIPNQSITSTPHKNSQQQQPHNYEKNSLSISTDTDSSEVSKQNYFKELHSKLVDISKDLSYHEDSLGTAELAQILQTLKENVSNELEKSNCGLLDVENIDSFTQSPLDLPGKSNTNLLSPVKDTALPNKSLTSDASPHCKSLSIDTSIKDANPNHQSISDTNATFEPDEQNKSLPNELNTNNEPRSPNSFNPAANSSMLKNVNSSPQVEKSIEEIEGEKTNVTNQINDNESTNCDTNNPNQQSNNTELDEVCLNTNPVQKENSNEKISIAETDIEAYKDKVAYLEELLNLKSPSKNGKHRLEFRSQQNIIKEYSLLEERNKMMQTQLNNAINQKRKYQNQVLNFESQKFAYEKEIKLLTFQKAAAENKASCLKIEKEKAVQEINTLKTDKEINANYQKENENLQQEINTLKTENEEIITNYQKENEKLQQIIQNLEDQNTLDENIKRNLNDLLEIAYGDIKDLKDLMADQSSVYNKAKDTMLNQLKNKNESIESIILVNEIGAIDLTLDKRTRATNNNACDQNRQPSTTNKKPPARHLILDEQQKQYLLNYRQNQKNSVYQPNYLQKELANQKRNPVSTENTQQSSDRASKENTQQEISRNDDKSPQHQTRQKDKHHSDYHQHLLKSRQQFYQQSRNPNSLNVHPIDRYDFAKKDNHPVRTRGRPVCPWYQNNKCYSDVCIYRHPKKQENSPPENSITLDDISDTKSNYDNPPICRYYLQGRCWFNEQCRNFHPQY